MALFLCRQLLIDLGKGSGIAHPVIGRQAHAQQDHLGPCRLGAVYHRSKILLQLLWRLSTQPIVAAQLDDHQARLMLCKQRRQPRLATCTGVTTDRGIDHLIARAFLLQPLLQQETHPWRVSRPKPALILSPTTSSVPAAALWARQYRARPALNHHTRIGFSMGPSILVAQHLSKVVPSAEGDLTILHALSST